MVQMTPGGWLQYLEPQLVARLPHVQLYSNYRAGQHRLRYATAKFRQAFGGLFREFADNWCEVIVEAPVERLRVQGYRFGPSTNADDDAWAIWQANNMDAQSSIVHREAITCCEAYWLVDPTTLNADGIPRITAEHPSQVIVAVDPADRRNRLAALKRYVDIDGFAYAYVYLPDGAVVFKSQEKPRGGARINWTRFDEVSYDLGAVPVVPVVNAPDMLGGGRSDLRNAVPMQDAINKTVLDMLIASEFGAFRQRVVLGVEAPQNPDGTPVANADIKLAMSKLLTFAEPTAKIAEFSATDLSNYTNALEPLVAHLAAQTRTPPHYLLGKMVNVSGDALKASEAGLVARTREKMTPFGEGHEETLRLAFKAMGQNDKAKQTRAETIWADPEFRNFSELVDGLVKLRGLNIPDEILWERAGFSPTEIARIKELQALDTILVEPRTDVPVTQPTATLSGGGVEHAAPAGGGPPNRSGTPPPVPVR